MKCPSCNRHVHSFQNWLSHLAANGVALPPKFRCPACRQPIRGSGLRKRARLAGELVFAVGIVGVIGYIYSLRQSATIRLPLDGAISLAQVVAMSIVVIMGSFLATWLMGRYQRDVRRRREIAHGGVAQTYYLIVASGEHRGEPIPISGEAFIVGSDPGCHLVEDNLAPRHCAFIASGGHIFLRDLDSGQPTRVRGDYIIPGDTVPLESGDPVEIGGVAYTLHYLEIALSTHELEEWAAHCLEGDGERLFAEDDVFKARKTQASTAAQDILDRIRDDRKGHAPGERLLIEMKGAVAVVRINVRDVVEDAHVELMRREFWKRLPNAAGKVIFDMKEVRRISEAGGFMLLDLCRQIRHRGGAVALCRLRQEASGVLEQLRSIKVAIYPDKASALAAMSGGAGRQGQPIGPVEPPMPPPRDRPLDGEASSSNPEPSDSEGVKKIAQ